MESEREESTAGVGCSIVIQNASLPVASTPSSAADSNTDVSSYNLNQQDYVSRLDVELNVVRSLNATMTSILRIFETARDDLVTLGKKMDRVRTASEHCRTQLLQRQHEQKQSELERQKKGILVEKGTPTANTPDIMGLRKRRRKDGSPDD